MLRATVAALTGDNPRDSHLAGGVRGGVDEARARVVRRDDPVGTVGAVLDVAEGPTAGEGDPAPQPGMVVPLSVNVMVPPVGAGKTVAVYVTT